MRIMANLTQMICEKLLQRDIFPLFSLKCQTCMDLSDNVSIIVTQIYFTLCEPQLYYTHTKKKVKCATDP